MKQETIDKANSLLKEIKNLEEHKTIIETPKQGYKNIILRPREDNNFNTRELLVEFLPMTADQLMHLYLITLESKIESLKKELEDLKD